MNYSVKSLMNKETLSYLFFGILTTIVNYVTFIGTLFLFKGENPLSANVVAFLFATVFCIHNK